MFSPSVSYADSSLIRGSHGTCNSSTNTNLTIRISGGMQVAGAEMTGGDLVIYRGFLPA